MRRLVVFAALACLGLALLSEAQAERIRNPTAGYSLEFPNGWAIEKKKGAFAVAHSDGSSFQSSPAELPANVTSLKVAALMGRASALAAGFCSKGATEFELAGPGWIGSGFHCNDRSDGKTRPSQTIGFTVKIKSTFHQFFLVCSTPGLGDQQRAVSRPVQEPAYRLLTARGKAD